MAAIVPGDLDLNPSILLVTTNFQNRADLPWLNWVGVVVHGHEPNAIAWTRVRCHWFAALVRARNADNAPGLLVVMPGRRLDPFVLTC